MSLNIKYVSWLGSSSMSAVSQNQFNSIGSLVQLIEVLQQIDISSLDAMSNEESIDDNNGGRIIL